jgi:hypothetical protein
LRRLLALLGLALLAAPAEAGPWAAGKGRLYAKLSLQHLRSRTLAAPDGTLFDIPLFTKDDAFLYAVYGLSDGLTLVANVPAYRVSDLRDEPDELGREAGVGDVQLGLQAQLGRRGAWVFAARGTVQLPTGDETRAGGLLPTGSGVWEGEGVLGAGRSFLGGRIYGFAEAGHMVRGGGLRDGFVYAAQVGWNAGERLVLAWNLRGVEPYSHAPREQPLGSPAGLGDRVTYAAYGPTAIVKLGKGWALQLDVDGAFRARNLAKGLVYRAGISYAR